MTDHDLAAIAAKLTDTQRKALLHPEWLGSGETQFALVDCIEAKLTGPLAHMHTLRWDRLTPLGLALRDHILSQEQNPS